MTLAAELLMGAIGESLPGPRCLLSDFGDGSPLLDECARPPVRIAQRPAGGLSFGGGCVSWRPPLSITRDREAAERAISSGALIVDATDSDAASLIGRAIRLAPENLTVIRLRGGTGKRIAPQHFRLLWDEADDRVFISGQCDTPELRDLASKLARCEIDEFDAFRTAAGGAVFGDMRFGVALAEVGLKPTAMIDQPEQRQIAHALGEGSAVFGENGSVALAMPQLAAQPASFGGSVSGLGDGAPAPVVKLSGAADWSVALQRSEGSWSFTATPDGARPATSVFLELRVSEAQSKSAWISDLWTGAVRRRGDWETWDEAAARLELEESW
ncbi:MAG: hypothetical protein AAF401_04800 [Pseudomonadota bacterium]